MNRFGQCCLLARRLIEAGVRFVTVNTFLTVFNEITWDIHGSKPFTSIDGMKNIVVPMYDQAYSALIEDLQPARHAGKHAGLQPGRVRPHAAGQSGRRTRPLAAVLDDVFRRRRRQRGPRRRAQRRHRRVARRAAGRSGGSRGHDLSQPGLQPGDARFPGRAGGLFRWSITASGKSTSCFRNRHAALSPQHRAAFAGPLVRAQLVAAFIVGCAGDHWQAAWRGVGASAGTWPPAIADRCCRAISRSTGPAAQQRLVRRARAQWSIRRAGERRSDDRHRAMKRSSAWQTAWRCRWATARPRSRPPSAIARQPATSTVEAMDEPFTWSFRNHVESVFSKAGCNLGACHGAFAGKKGFKLSLRGFDAEGRLFVHHPAGPRAASDLERSGAEPDVDQAHGHDPAQRGRALCRRFARVSRDRRVDRRRGSGATGRRSADRAAWKLLPGESRLAPGSSSSSSCGPSSTTATPKT